MPLVNPPTPQKPSFVTVLTNFLAGYKIMIASAILAVLGVLQGLDWVTILNNPRAYGWATVWTACWYAILRVFTNTTVFKTTSPAPMPPGFRADGSKIEPYHN